MSDAILIQAGGNLIVNSGEITSNNDEAIDINASFESGLHSNTIINTGVIAGNGNTGDAIQTSSDDDSAFNDGSIVGGVNLSAGNNFLRNSGTIDGDVLFGTGADTFDDLGGTVAGMVNGGDGDDIYLISDGTILLFEDSGEGTDYVYSTFSYTLGDNFEHMFLMGSGDITAVGNTENNTIDGNIGDNIIDGAGGDDVLEGRGDDDRLEGGNGMDILRGGNGDDELRGDMPKSW